MGFEDLPEGPTFTAQFNSDCADCEFPIKVGQLARFDVNEPVHVDCPKRRPACQGCGLVHGITQEECEW